MRTTSRIQAMLCRFCHAMGYNGNSALSVQGVSLAAFKKTAQSCRSRNSAGWEHLHRIRSHWSLKGLVCELPRSPQIERFSAVGTSWPSEATLSRSRFCRVKELMPFVRLHLLLWLLRLYSDLTWVACHLCARGHNLGMTSIMNKLGRKQVHTQLNAGK